MFVRSPANIFKVTVSLMPRPKTITDEEILTFARNLFLKEGAKASTRTLAKIAGISEAVIFQRFHTKEALFFAAMVMPSTQIDDIFEMVQPGQKSVSTNLELLSLQILDYFREVMPVFLSLLSHPALIKQTLLESHTMPGIQLNTKLTEYLNAEAQLGRICTDDVAAVAGLLLAYLHNLALSENISSSQPMGIENAITKAIALLWTGIAPLS